MRATRALQRGDHPTKETATDGVLKDTRQVHRRPRGHSDAISAPDLPMEMQGQVKQVWQEEREETRRRNKRPRFSSLLYNIHDM